MAKIKDSAATKDVAVKGAGLKGIFSKLFGADPLMKKIWFGVFVVSLYAAPFYFNGIGRGDVVRTLGVIGLYAILALGLNIVAGWAGLLDFGAIAFYAVGAYTAMWVGMPFAAWAGEYIGGAAYFVALPFGGLAAALVGIMLGIPVLRLRGDYLAIVTLGFGEIVRILMNNDFLGLSNGAAGLPRAGEALPRPFGLDWLRDNTYFAAGNFHFEFTKNVYWYLIIASLVLFAIWVVRRQDNSRLGRAWAALREDDVAASAMGVNLTKAKLYAFSMGAIWGGLAGTTFAFYQEFISPESFSFMESVFVLSIVVIGGMGSIPGVLVGAFIIQGVPEFIRIIASSGALEPFGIHLSGEAVSAISNYRMLALGVLMVVMMAVKPEGLIPSKRLAREMAIRENALAEESTEAKE